jgi:hypothetical protein
MVEIFVGIISAKPSAVARSTASKDLEAAIGAYIAGWNERAYPFIWTKSADTTSSATPHPHPTRKTYDPRLGHQACSLGVLDRLDPLELLLDQDTVRAEKVGNDPKRQGEQGSNRHD